MSKKLRKKGREPCMGEQRNFGKSITEEESVNVENENVGK